jgi:hypothetical protein
VGHEEALSRRVHSGFKENFPQDLKCIFAGGNDHPDYEGGKFFVLVAVRISGFSYDSSSFNEVGSWA